MTVENVTALELEVLRAILRSDFQNEPDGTGWVWSNDVATTRPRAGALGSLVKKGLVQPDGNAGREACVRLTPAGASLVTATA